MGAVTTESVIGFVGLGVMGRSMASNVLRAGFPLLVYSRTADRAAELLAAGARWRDSAGLVAAEADVVVTMVGYPSDVEQVYFQTDGILDLARPGTRLVDMTTSTPALAQRIATTAASRRLAALDAPVSGGDVGAREGRLVILAGGDEQTFVDLQPLLRVLGQNVSLQGPAGAGQHSKVCNQIAVAASMIGISEALAYAAGAGLDGQGLLAAISGGAAGSWSMSNLAPRVLAGDFAPGFYIRHMLKDLRIALEMAADMRLSLPGVRLAETLYTQLEERGLSNQGTQALYRWYREDS